MEKMNRKINRKINRRSFLNQSTGILAGAALLNSNPLVFPDAVGANERVRIAILGLRGRGHNHVTGYSSLKNVEVAAVCDPDVRLHSRAAEAAAQKQGALPKKIQDFRQVLEDKTVDAISIATPDHWHALATIWGCQAGKDVYVEKPISHSPWEGRKMVEAARRHHRIV